MKQEHCKELNEILTSKPHILERYGIIVIISILLLIGAIISKCHYIEQINISQITSCRDTDMPIFIAQEIEGKSMSSLINHDFALIIDGRRFICKGITTQNAGEKNKLYFRPQSIESSDSIQYLITTNPNIKLIETRQSYIKIVINPILEIFGKE